MFLVTILGIKRIIHLPNLLCAQASEKLARQHTIYTLAK
jgi:hypothetical protein